MYLHLKQEHNDFNRTTLALNKFQLNTTQLNSTLFNLALGMDVKNVHKKLNEASM